MRAIGAALGVLLLAACGNAASGAPPTPSATSCAGYSSTYPAIKLTNADSGRSIDARVCDSIWIVITGGQGAAWQFPESSDASVLEVVPLPLPHPPNGVEAVYLAKRSGRATLTAQPGISCPPNAMCLAPEPWVVTVTVTP